jgi:hypothetical protein
MLSDPLTLTISGVGNSLPRTEIRDRKATYSKDDGTVKLSADHQIGKRSRHQFRTDLTKISADPFLPAQNVTSSMSCYVVFDMPPVGYSVAEAVALYTGMNTLLSASTNAVLAAFLGGQS